MKTAEATVFCHGLFGSLADKFFLKHYKEQRVLAPDLLGYGDYYSQDVSSLSLTDQADHVLACMINNGITRANLVGHSVGGAVAALLAIRHPDKVKALISVEGNMTPPDAFWSASLAKKSLSETQIMVDGYQSDVAAWISAAGVEANSETLRIASDWLNHQSAGTLKAQAQAVVEATSEQSGFIAALKAQLDNELELHLVAGANSRNSWHVPKNIEAMAASVTILPNSGHLMMLQSPAGFADVIQRIVG